MWWKDPQHETQLVLLGLGASALLLHLAVPWFRKGRPEKVLLAVMAVAALGSGLAYTRFLDFQGPRRGELHTYHDHDVYHYAIGAKYYPELGHERLYECTWLAFAELRSSGVKTPRVPRLRDLAEPDRFFVAVNERPRIEASCHTAFSEARWREFKNDLRAWLASPLPDQAWQVALVDLGFNPPPTYNLFAHNIAEAKRIQNATLQLYPFLDMTLIFVVGGGLMYWAFGPWGLGAYLVVFGTNWVASYRWTGGSFCRQLWFASLVYASCFLKKEHYTWAGVFLALCASMRVFPLVFVLGAVVAMAGLAARDPSRRTDLAKLVGAGLGTAVLLFAASLAQFGWGLWQEFFHKMSHHGTSWFLWHIGFKKWAVFFPEVAETSGVRLAKGWWWARPATFEEIFASYRWIYEPIRLTMSAGVLAVAWRRPAHEATLLTGAILLFLWSMPANYYYVYLALFPAVFYVPGNPFALARVGLTFAAMVSLSWSPWIHDEPFVQNGWMNQTVFWLFVALLLSYAAEFWQARRMSQPVSSEGDAEPAR